jgi:hypothetical protein
LRAHRRVIGPNEECIGAQVFDDALFVGDAINNLNIPTGQPGAHVSLQVANTSTNQAYESLSRIEDLDAHTCTSGTATHLRKEPAQSSPRPAPNADQTHPDP